MYHFKFKIFTTYSRLNPFLFPILFLALLLNSCSVSIEKRLYRPGYHVDHVAKRNRIIVDTKNQANKDRMMHATVNKNDIHPVSINHQKKDSIIVHKTIPLVNNRRAEVRNTKPRVTKQYYNTDCDEIVLTSGTKIFARVFEVSEKEIKYKSCDDPAGPTFIIPTTKINFIALRNGDVYRPQSQKGKNDVYKPIDKKFVDVSFIISIVVLSLAVLAFIFSFIVYPVSYAGFIISVISMGLSIISFSLGFRALRDSKDLKVKLTILFGFIALLFATVALILLFL